MIPLRPLIFHPSFMHRVTVGTKRLPVIRAPKQDHVTAMRNDVIDQGGQECATFAQVYAPGIRRQERLARLAPAMIVATSMRSGPTGL